MRRAVCCFMTAIVAFTCLAEDWPTWQHDVRRTGSTKDAIEAGRLQLEWSWESPTPPQTAWAGPAKYDAYAFHRNLPSMRSYDSVFHMIAVNESVWFGSSVDDTLYCLDASTGEERWAYTTDGPIRLAPTWSDNRILFGSDDGFARCLNAKSGELIWKFTPNDSKDVLINNGRFISFSPCRTGVTVANDTAWFACAMLPESLIRDFDIFSQWKPPNEGYLRKALAWPFDTSKKPGECTSHGCLNSLAFPGN